jgi:hypothetical protein
MTNTVPNLDCMDVEELQGFTAKYWNSSKVLAEELIGDRRRGFKSIADQLVMYARHKTHAIKHRTEGEIGSATVFESICDRIYAKLPEDLRW